MIGTVIQNKRKELGITQAQLAEALGVSAPAVNRWEKNMCYPDAELLAPLARLLNTDINTLFSYYSKLSEKDREIIINDLTSKTLDYDLDELTKYIQEIVRQNPSDGELFREIADELYATHLFKKSIYPNEYLKLSASYYERALELCSDDKEEIFYSLMNIYSELGLKAEAEDAWGQLSSSKYSKQWTHIEMLLSNEAYVQAIQELRPIILKDLVDLVIKLQTLSDAFKEIGDEAMTDLSLKKASDLCDIFELNVVKETISVEQDNIDKNTNISESLSASQSQLFRDIVFSEDEKVDVVDLIIQMMQKIQELKKKQHK